MPVISERKFSPSTALQLKKQGVSSTLARLYAARGIKHSSEILSELENLIPYKEMKGCVEAADFLLDAMGQYKRILIISDYDADGATACAVGMRALRAWGADVEYLIPSRLEHGYGLTPEIVDIAAAQFPKPDIIITVDNGISSHAGVARANEHGIDVLVTDHHLPAETLPAARLIVNPNQPGCPFESKNIAGCGVIWYVMWALYDRLPKATKNLLDVKSLLSIVAVGTVADVVKLDNNNRILVNQGLRLIRDGHGFAGIEALAKVAKKSPGSLTTADIGFGIGPRINAAGRLESMDKGVSCLLCDDFEKASAMAVELTEINEKRKAIELEMVQQAGLEIDTSFDVKEGYTIAVSHPSWHQGVIGIVAGRLKEKFYRPTFALAPGNNGEYKGSGRSIPGFHLRDALDLVSKKDNSVLVKFGGHAMAAGVTVAPGKVERFAELFEEVARQMLTPAELNQVIETDGPIPVGELNLNTAAELEYAVWGQGFPPPLFSDVFDVVSYKHLGATKEHLRMTLRKNDLSIPAIQFRSEVKDIPSKVRLVYQLSINEYKERVSLQLLIQHLEPA